MSTLEIKQALHQLVDEMENETKLTAMMKSATEIAFKIKEVNITNLSTAERIGIEKGVEDVRNGNVKSHDEVMKFYNF